MILGGGSLQSFPTAIAVGVPEGFRRSSSLQKRKAGRNGPKISDGGRYLGENQVNSAAVFIGV